MAISAQSAEGIPVKAAASPGCLGVTPSQEAGEVAQKMRSQGQLTYSF